MWQARAGVLALLLAFASAASFAASLANAYVMSRRDSPSLSPYGGLESGVRWGTFVKLVGLFAQPTQLVFLVGALALATVATGSGSRPARLALWVLFPVGLVVGVAAGYGSVLAVVDDGSGRSAGLLFVDGAAQWFQRAVAALLYGVTCVGSVYVAWCAFQALPISRPAPSPERQRPDEQGSPEVPSV